MSPGWTTATWPRTRPHGASPPPPPAREWRNHGIVVEIVRPLSRPGERGMGEHAGGAKIARAFQVAHLLVVEERHIAEAMQLLNVMTKHDARPGVPGLRISHSVRSEEHTSELQSLMRISYA